MRLCLGVGGRACTPQFSWWAAKTWWEIYTLFGMPYMALFVAAVSALPYILVTRIAVFRRSMAGTFAGLLIVLLIFLLAAWLTHEGNCIYP